VIFALYAYLKLFIYKVALCLDCVFFFKSHTFQITDFTHLCTMLPEIGWVPGRLQVGFRSASGGFRVGTGSVPGRLRVGSGWASGGFRVGSGSAFISFLSELNQNFIRIIREILIN
jgi:hypothetical protein